MSLLIDISHSMTQGISALMNVSHSRQVCSNPHEADDPEVVFNTEAHPFKAPPPKSSYGTNRIIPGKPFTAKSGPPLPAVSPNPFVPLRTTPQ